MPAIQIKQAVKPVKTRRNKQKGEKMNMNRKKIISTLEKQIALANGRRHAHIIPPSMAEEIYDKWIETRKAVSRLHHDPATVNVTYDPNCVPNCYKWAGSTTAVVISESRIAGRRKMAFETRFESRPRGVKWSWKIEFTPNEKNSVPEGFSSKGVCRI
jgi:hypothetical protein